MGRVSRAVLPPSEKSSNGIGSPHICCCIERSGWLLGVPLTVQRCRNGSGCTMTSRDSFALFGGSEANTMGSACLGYTALGYRWGLVRLKAPSQKVCLQYGRKRAGHKPLPLALKLSLFTEWKCTDTVKHGIGRRQVFDLLG